MQNGEFRTRITSLSWFQLPSVVFACETATLGLELQVSMGPRPRLWIFECKTARSVPEWKVYIGSSPHLWFCALQNSDNRGRVTGLYVSHTSSVGLCTHNRVLSTRISSPYGFQPSPVVLCIKNRDFRTRTTSLCGSQTSPMDLCTHNRVLITRISSLYGFQPSPVALCMQTANLGREL